MIRKNNKINELNKLASKLRKINNYMKNVGISGKSRQSLLSVLRLAGELENISQSIFESKTNFGSDVDSILLSKRGLFCAYEIGTASDTFFLSMRACAINVSAFVRCVLCEIDSRENVERQDGTSFIEFDSALQIQIHTTLVLYGILLQCLAVLKGSEYPRECKKLVRSNRWCNAGLHWRRFRFS